MPWPPSMGVVCCRTFHGGGRIVDQPCGPMGWRGFGRIWAGLDDSASVLVAAWKPPDGGRKVHDRRRTGVPGFATVLLGGALDAVRVTEDAIQFTVSGVPGRGYAIERSDSLERHSALACVPTAPPSIPGQDGLVAVEDSRCLRSTRCITGHPLVTVPPSGVGGR